MPIYEYRRPDGSTFEIVQTFSDEPLTHDPDTGVPVERVLHAPAVHFKGSGFYNTDYGTRKRQRENAAGSSDDSAKKADSSEKEKATDKGSTSTPSSDSASSGASTSSNGAKPKETKPVAAKS